MTYLNQGEYMKNLKGFRGKYFSLAAILALSTSVTLANEVQSFTDSKKDVQTQEAYDEKEELTPSHEELDVAVVSKTIKAKKSKVYSASKSYVSATNVTDNVNILTSQEMQLQGITTVKDALKSLPGISVTTSGGLGQTSSVFVQGFSNQYLLVLVDGVRYNDPSNTSGARLDTLLIDDIDKIEVIKGAQSGVWGADAAAGVVNIITKKATPGTHASVGVEVGSYNTKTLSSSISHKTHSYDVMLSYLRTTSDGFSALVPSGENAEDYEDDAYRSTTLNFNGGYWFDSNNRVEVGYHDINSLSDYDMSDANSNGSIDYRGQSGYLKYKHYMGKHLIETTLTQNNFQYKDLTTTWGVNNSIGQTPSLEVKDTYKYAKNSMLVFGGYLEKRKVKYTEVGSSQEEQDDNSKALFANNTFEYNDFVFSGALRYDEFSAYDNKLTGKLGIKYNISEDFNIYANYGTAYKTPNIMDMINIWGLSNFDLNPENIKSFNTGIEYKGLHVNYFYNQIDDMITWNSATWQNENLEGTSTLKGIELSYQKTFFDKLLLGANYTYTDAKDSDGDRLSRRPRYQIGLNASYSILNDFMISASGTYIGSRLDYTYDSSYNVIDVETGRYFVANAKVDYNINKTWSTYLKLDNIFDKEYQTVYGYATAGQSIYLGAKAKF
jgi:vitamin B12 transporter